MIGERISNYTILEELGRGGCAVVYKAHDHERNRVVALKVLELQVVIDEQRERFYREARMAAVLDHPGICKIYDIDETPDSHILIAMDYCQGESLRARIRRGPLAVAEAVGIARQVCEVLAEAHGHGIVHRDIKPGNVMVSDDGRVTLLDFGLAKDPGDPRLTEPGSVLGTVAYMSPEQAMGHEVDQRTDIWSLGVVLYEMLSGSRPFAGESLLEQMEAVLTTEPRPVRELRPEVPPVLEQVVARCLIKDRVDRYPSVQDLASAFQHAMGELEA